MKVSSIAVPASFFGMVLGLVGLGDCWRVAAKAWGYPHAIDEAVMGMAFAVWVLVMALYIGKWLWARDEALAELNHPVQNCFIGLSGVATMLAAVAIAPPHSTGLPLALAVVGGAITLAYGVYFTARQWTGERELETASPALYLPRSRATSSPPSWRDISAMKRLANCFLARACSRGWRSSR